MTSTENICISGLRIFWYRCVKGENDWMFFSPAASVLLPGVFLEPPGGFQSSKLSSQQVSRGLVTQMIYRASTSQAPAHQLTDHTDHETSIGSTVLFEIRWLPYDAQKEYIIFCQGVFCVAKSLVGGFGCDELVLYGIRELAPAIPRKCPRHRGGPV